MGLNEVSYWTIYVLDNMDYLYIFIPVILRRRSIYTLFYLGAKLSLDPVEVVVQITPFHQIPAPSSQLGNDSGSLRKKQKHLTCISACTRFCAPSRKKTHSSSARLKELKNNKIPHQMQYARVYSFCIKLDYCQLPVALLFKVMLYLPETEFK